MKNLGCGLLLWALSVCAVAQSLTSATPYDLTSTLGSPLSLPFRFDLSGRLSFRLAQGTATVFPVFTHAAWERQKYDFVPATSGLTADWTEAAPTVPRLRVRRHRVEGGLGIGAATKLLSGRLGLSLGLVPFKGASWESRAFKEPLDGRWSLPLDPLSWDDWSLGEGRDYQVYGGFTAALGVSMLGLEAAQIFRTTQQRWLLSLEKISSKHLRVRVRRDSWKKNGYVLGPAVANWERAALTYFDQERAYLLDMQDPAGPEALRALWAGRLDELQTSAATSEEGNVRAWNGTYRARYLGVPYIYGQNTARVELQSWETADGGRALGILNLQTRNKGVLREADPQVWTIVHDPQDGAMYFLAISQSIERGSVGVHEKLGHWMERLGLHMEWPSLSRKDFLDARLMFAVTTASWERWAKVDVRVESYQELCADVGLKCQNERTARKGVESWNRIRERRDVIRPLQMAEFLIRHPLLWGLLVIGSKDKITAEFMAHGDRWMPVQKILVTP
jgi:hypothetical protein